MKKARASGVEWNMVPPAHFEPSKYRIQRTPQRGGINGVIVNEVVFGTGPHYANGRTQPCFEAGCENCLKMCRRDWHGYFFLMGKKTREVVIFEVTAGPACRLYEEYKKYRTLRGLECCFLRANDQPNGRVIVRFGDKVANVHDLPEVPDIRETMENIWGVTLAPSVESEPTIVRNMSEADLVRDGVRKCASLNGQQFLQHD